jgi:hypothetical protein
MGIDSGLDKKTIESRLNEGWSVEIALGKAPVWKKPE